MNRKKYTFLLIIKYKYSFPLIIKIFKFLTPHHRAEVIQIGIHTFTQLTIKMRPKHYMKSRGHII